MGLIARHLEILSARGLDPETLARYGVGSSPRVNGEDWIRIPYFEGEQVVNWKHRTISGEKRFHQEPGAKKCFWNINVLLDASLADQPLLITEGELDALTAIQCGFARTMSVPDGAPATAVGEDDSGRKYSYVQDAKAALSQVREIILCTDSDGPGVNLLNDLAIRLGKVRCKWVKYPRGCKDLNDALRAFGPRGVTETIARAQFMRVDGVYRMSELPPAPNYPALRMGLEQLDGRYRVRAGDLCVVTGIPSHGKSTFINEVACRMVEQHRWPVAFASFEQLPQIDHRRALRAWRAGKPEWEQSHDELLAADLWIDANFVFLVPNEDEDVTLAWTLERCAAAVVQHGVRMIVIDPWNEMDHIRPPEMSLTEYTGFAIKQFRKLARKYQAHLVVAAHPAKLRKEKDGSYAVPTLYDISDSAHWYNKPEVGIVVHRIGEHETLIRVAKSRYHEVIGQPGDVMMRFSAYDRRFRELLPEPRLPLTETAA